jgi:hypothetical protein
MYNWQANEKFRSTNGRVVVQRCDNPAALDWLLPPAPVAPPYLYSLALQSPDGRLIEFQRPDWYIWEDYAGEPLTSRKAAELEAQRWAEDLDLAFCEPRDAAFLDGFIVNEASQYLTLTGTPADGYQTLSIPRKTPGLAVVVSIAGLQTYYKGNRRTLKRSVEDIEVVERTASSVTLEGVSEAFGSTQPVTAKCSVEDYAQGRVPKDWTSNVVSQLPSRRTLPTWLQVVAEARRAS